MPVVSVVLAGLMMRTRRAIRLGMRIACRRTPTAIGFRGYSLWTPDSRECGYSVRIQCVRLHDRAICTRGSPGPDKLESVCTGCHIHASHLSLSLSLCLCFTLMFSLTHTDTHTHTYMRTFISSMFCQKISPFSHLCFLPPSLYLSQFSIFFSIQSAFLE